MSGSLQGTLTPQGPKTLEEAQAAQAAQEFQQFIGQLSQQAQGASQGAAQAGQAYQQLAQAPSPQVDPMQAFVQTLLGNTASVLGETPQYREDAQKSLNDERMALLAQRAQTLASLKENYQQQADAAAKAGDLLAQTQLLEKKDRMAKAHEALHDKIMQGYALDQQKERDKEAMERTEATHKGRLSEIAATGAEQRKTLMARPKMTQSERAASVRQGINPDTGFLIPGFAMTEQTKRMTLARQRGNQQARDAAFNGMWEIATQRWDSDKTPEKMMSRLMAIQNPFKGTTPKDAVYALTNEKIYRKIKGKWVKDQAAADRAAAIANDIVTPWFEVP